MSVATAYYRKRNSQRDLSKTASYCGTTLGSYNNAHSWLRRNYGSADRCENPNCVGESRLFQWSLVKGKRYEKRRENFQRLCIKCHGSYDKWGRKPKDHMGFCLFYQGGFVKSYARVEDIIKETGIPKTILKRACKDPIYTKHEAVEGRGYKVCYKSEEHKYVNKETGKFHSIKTFPHYSTPPEKK